MNALAIEIDKLFCESRKAITQAIPHMSPEYVETATVFLMGGLNASQAYFAYNTMTTTGKPESIVSHKVFKLINNILRAPEQEYGLILVRASLNELKNVLQNRKHESS